MVVISEDVLQRILMEPAAPFTGYAGAIVRLTLKDFMTYHKAELIPGPHINLVLGPNGTGKSTIVNAICLGLNGKTKILGRANTIKEFIRRGCKSSYIEVELFNPTGSNYIVRRSFKISSNSSVSTDWYINGRHVQTPDIEDLLGKLNIQLDNLCQFLPQDRMEEFSKLDPYSLLVSTEKAIGNDTLFNQHENLIKLNSNIETVDYNLKMTSKSLNTELQYTKNMENDVHCIEERERVKLRIAELNSMKVWTIFLQAIEVFSNVQIELNKITEQKKKEENTIAPLKGVVNFLESKLSKSRQEMNKTRSANGNAMTTIKRAYDDQLDDIANEISDVQGDLEAQENSEKERINRLNNAIQKVSSIREEIKQRGNVDEAALQDEIKSIEKRNNKIADQVFEMKGRDKHEQAEIYELQGKIRNVNIELRLFKGWRKSRMSYLYRVNRDVHGAVEYFQNADNLVGLKGKYYEPMILHLNVKDDRHGRILERHVPLSNMIAFFVELHSDVSVLSELAARKNFRISIMQHDPKGSGVPKSKYSREFLRRFKFAGVLSELVEADVYFLTFLCKKFAAHDVPIGSDATDAISSIIMEETDLRTYYTEKFVYKTKVSAYSKNKSSTISHLNQAKIFTDQLNITEKTKLEEEVIELQRQCDQIDRRIKGRSPELHALETKQRLEEEKIKELQGRIQYFRTLESKLVSAEKTVQIYERTKINLPALREDARRKINALNVTSVKASTTVTKQTADITSKNIRLLALKRIIAATQSCIISCQNQMEDTENVIATYTNQVKLLDEELKKAAHVAERRQKEAHATSAQPPKPVADKLVNLTDIEKELRLSNVQLGLFADTDPSILGEYNKKMKRIEDLTRQKEKEENELISMKAVMEKQQKEWLVPLENLLKRINSNFGRLFAVMNCGGEVKLHIPENPMHYDKYGVTVWVRFRSTEPLSELTGFKQSGGERAISTALYILSLQELTTVPFRVIDEINQGMDAKNEALFFRLLSELAEGPKTPQYFLLTPKTLPTTEFGDNVSFHIIFNGPYVEVPIKETEKPKRNSSSKSDRKKHGESSKRREDDS